MFVFNGTVALAAGGIETLQELVIAALNARTYDADSATNVKLKAEAVSNFRSATAVETFIKSDADIYMMDGYKGIINGVVTSAKWTATDFTGAGAGHGELLPASDSKHYFRAVQPSNRVLYAAADANIILDLSQI